MTATPSDNADLIGGNGQALRVYLEDHGQDLLRFTLRNGLIEDCNLQSWLWDGSRVVNENIRPGDLIQFDGGNCLNYPVATVSTVPAEAGQ